MRCRSGYEVGMAAAGWTEKCIWMQEVARENWSSKAGSPSKAKKVVDVGNVKRSYQRP